MITHWNKNAKEYDVQQDTQNINYQELKIQKNQYAYKMNTYEYVRDWHCMPIYGKQMEKPP